MGRVLARVGSMGVSETGKPLQLCLMTIENQNAASLAPAYNGTVCPGACVANSLVDTQMNAVEDTNWRMADSMEELLAFQAQSQVIFLITTSHTVDTATSRDTCMVIGSQVPRQRHVFPTKIRCSCNVLCVPDLDVLLFSGRAALKMACLCIFGPPAQVVRRT
jgi:hypothetical protein